jgi:hypothetical protein
VVVRRLPSAERFPPTALQLQPQADGEHPDALLRSSLDRQMSQAVRLRTVDPTAAAARWAQVDHDLTDQAPQIPVFTPTNIDIVSNRVGNC